jgi:hypothetical protein
MEEKRKEKGTNPESYPKQTDSFTEHLLQLLYLISVLLWSYLTESICGRDHLCPDPLRAIVEQVADSRPDKLIPSLEKS